MHDDWTWSGAVRVRVSYDSTGERFTDSCVVMHFAQNRNQSNQNSGYSFGSLEGVFFSPFSRHAVSTFCYCCIALLLLVVLLRVQSTTNKRQHVSTVTFSIWCVYHTAAVLQKRYLVPGIWYLVCQETVLSHPLTNSTFPSVGLDRRQTAVQYYW